jgi:hypothetical protein
MNDAPDNLPVALVEPVRRRSLAWLLPILALALAAFLAFQSWSAQGTLITVRAAQGHGIKPGDSLQYRGIDVGRVDTVRLASDMQAVRIDVRLDPEAGLVARAGSRFWIVRPRVALDSVQGLETIIGARYLAVLPGPVEGGRRTEFVALDEAPVLEEPGGLELTLEAPSRFSLAPGAPLYYRKIQIGSVLSVGLSSDAASVEVRCKVREAYVNLVRTNSRFWEVGGVEIGLTLTGGLEISMDSVRSMLVGGVALGTPPDAGDPVTTGHRFTLHGKPEKEWLTWRPALGVGSALLPPGAAQPRPLRAHLGWKQGRLLKRKQSRTGWLLRTEAGVVGPADLLTPPEDALEGTTVLEVAGQAIPLSGAPADSERGVARRSFEVGDEEPWPEDRRRPPERNEDCLVFGDPTRAPRAVSAARLVITPRGLEVDDALAFDEDWHGAAVLSREDGALLGILLVERDGARIAPLP